MTGISAGVSLGRFVVFQALTLALDSLLPSRSFPARFGGVALGAWGWGARFSSANRRPRLSGLRQRESVIRCRAPENPAVINFLLN